MSAAGGRSLPFRWWAAWNHFWFDAPAERPLRLFRIGMGWLLFIFYLMRIPDLEFLYSESGLLSRFVLPEVLKLDFRFSLFQYFNSNGAVQVIHWVFLGALLAMTWRRTAIAGTWIALALHLSFLHRNPAGSYGVDLISVFFLFYLALAGNGKGDLGSVAYRMAQIQVCIIYGYSGFHKLKSPAWWQGDAVWQVLANRQLARWDFSWLASFPSVIVLATYLTVLFEIYFPVAIWLRPTRIAWLSLGIGLHLAIGFTIQIPYFAALMVLTYVFFLREQGLARIEKYLDRGVKIFKVRSPSSDRYIV